MTKRLRPEDVRWHHFRDYAWRLKWCERCRDWKSKWHEHHTREGHAVSAVATGDAIGKEERIDDGIF